MDPQEQPAIKINRLYNPHDQKPVDFYDTKVAKDEEERKVYFCFIVDDENIQPQSLQ